MTTTAILLAGGSGTRLGTGDNKAYLPLDGHPLLTWSLTALERCDQVDDVVLVTRAEDQPRAEAIAEAAGITKLRTIVEGGTTRHASEQAGLDAVAAAIEDGRVTLVTIHDAARPFVSDALLTRLIDAAREHGGSVPALEVGTPFLIRSEVTPPVLVWTDDLRRMQTPQAFHARPLLDAYRAATAAGFHGVDTAETVEHHSRLTVVAVEGDPDNRKVTFVDDLRAAEDRARTWPERPVSVRPAPLAAERSSTPPSRPHPQGPARPPEPDG
jgi:2-C-methyl-D-erythritol 4-phosphate cytidylyltransferase